MIDDQFFILGDDKGSFKPLSRNFNTTKKAN